MKQQDVHLFVFDGLSDWEASYAIAGINHPQLQKNSGRYRIRSVALKATPVISMGGLSIQPNITLDAISPNESAMLIMPGGPTWDSGLLIEPIEVARTFLNTGTPVAAICGATAGLAAGGLLDTRRHTSNSRDYLSATNYAGAKLYEETPAVTDGPLITASGTAPVDFAYHIFKCLDIYTDAILEAWYGLFKTGQATYFTALMDAADT